MIGEFLDRVIGVFSPAAQLRRAFARAQIGQVRNSASRHKSMDELLGVRTGYDAAARNRLTTHRQSGAISENSIARDTIQQLRNDSWNLWRNNPHARKICTQLEAKVIGRGMQPYPLATLPDGEPDLEWRARARQLWRDISQQIDYRGRPGRGGQHFVDLAKTALRGTVLGGETFLRFRRLTQRRQTELGLILPLQIQLISPDRLDVRHNDDNEFYGISFNQNSERSYYFFLDDTSLDATARRVRSADIVHLYVAYDIDQIRGTPWFAAALLKMRDVGDYEYNELQAAAMAACVVLGYRRSSGQTSFGLQNPDADWDLTDGEGNPVSNLSPGMILDLGQTGEIQEFNPSRPNNNAPEFISHMVRTEAAAVPGVKPSSLTGDYRGASFSSERSADNDVWPELEGVQDWMAWTFYQPVYEEVVDAAVTAGYFDGIAGFQLADYLVRRQAYLRTEWRGPVARSINPTDDAKAGQERMKSLTSSPQREAALLGVNLQDVLEEWEELRVQLTARGLPADEVIKQLLGVQQPAAAAVAAGDGDSEDDPGGEGEGEGEGDDADDGQEY
jgi:lambda family phage portal protein